MPENKQSKSQQPAGSTLELQLRSHNILLKVEELGIISNEIQALGSLLESLGAAITVRGNLIGRYGFNLETIATRLHITSSLQELYEQDSESKSSILLQIRAYNILLMANMLGIMSNEIQAVGAVIQTAAGIIIAYGNFITVTAFELERISTRLLILSVLQEMEQQQNQYKPGCTDRDVELNVPQEVYSSRQLEQLYLKINQLEDSMSQQQGQIQKIQQQLQEYNGKQ